jgi:Icc-related predicted phosphoesterase
MKILILGAAHGSPKIHAIMKGVNAKAALQVGDLNTYTEMPLSTYFVSGDHEDHMTVQDMRNGSVAIPNLHLMTPGRVVNLDGITVTGISGNYSESYYPKRRSELNQNRTRHFTSREIEVCKQTTSDIFLSHEVPAGLGFTHPSRNFDYGCKPIREVVDAMGPKVVLCGSIQHFKRVDYNDTKIYSLDLLDREYYILNTKTMELDRHIVMY